MPSPLLVARPTSPRSPAAVTVPRQPGRCGDGPHAPLSGGQAPPDVTGSHPISLGRLGYSACGSHSGRAVERGGATRSGRPRLGGHHAHHRRARVGRPWRQELAQSWRLHRLFQRHAAGRSATADVGRPPPHLDLGAERSHPSARPIGAAMATVRTEHHRRRHCRGCRTERPLAVHNSICVHSSWWSERGAARTRHVSHTWLGELASLTGSSGPPLHPATNGSKRGSRAVACGLGRTVRLWPHLHQPHTLMQLAPQRHPPGIPPGDGRSEA